ncbi:MAG TPA: ABC transporter ATP-binding protein [Actinomycetota bacterium]|nr:ABC transporter ATP-binding protein [Actinomycetota bacterium]
MSASLVGVRKAYGSVVALDGVDVDAAPGELLVVLGPSGSGKSTMLRCVAGLEIPDEGRVEVGGRDVTRLPPGRRDVAMVFQDYALYPHVSVAGNVAFGLRARGVARADVEGRVRATADMLGIGALLDRRPDELSGGERQRVALARAVVREPSVFLLDEPMSNLDAELRTSTRAEIKALQRRLGTTTLYVTHDQVEAMTMGDRVVVVRAGRVEQTGTTADVYDRPATAFVARFLGSPPMNLLDADALGRAARGSVVGIRPEDVELVAADGRLEGVVEAVETLGDVAVVRVDVRGRSVLAKVRRGREPAPSARVGLRFADDAVHEFDGFDGRALR